MMAVRLRGAGRRRQSSTAPRGLRTSSALDAGTWEDHFGNFRGPGSADDLAASAMKWLAADAGWSKDKDVIAVRVTDPFEEELPSAGRLVFEDLESGGTVEVDTRSRAVREDWARRAAERADDEWLERLAELGERIQKERDPNERLAVSIRFQNMIVGRGARLKRTGPVPWARGEPESEVRACLLASSGHFGVRTGFVRDQRSYDDSKKTRKAPRRAD